MADASIQNKGAGDGAVTRTILDYLNEDCWSEVLSYVPTRDVIRTERVSRRWQQVVLGYLAHTPVDICYIPPGHYEASDGVCRLEPEDWASFNRWASKLGQSVRTVYCRRIEDHLRVIKRKCPNLKSLMLIRLPERPLTSYRSNNLSQLQALCFETCYQVSDDCIKQFISNNALYNLESLEIRNNEQVTGECLAGMPLANLKSILLSNCPELEVDPLLSASFHQLTSLEMVCESQVTYRNIHMLLNNTPQLEHLRLAICKVYPVYPFLTSYLPQCVTFFEAVCQLRYLKHLDVHDLEVTDENLDAVTGCCTELQTLHLGCCFEVTGRGVVVAARNAGPRLTGLILANCRRITDDEAVECIRLCLELKALSLIGCSEGLTPALLPRAAAARRDLRARRPLYLNVLNVTGLEGDDEHEYPELVVKRNPTTHHICPGCAANAANQ